MYWIAFKARGHAVPISSPQLFVKIKCNMALKLQSLDSKFYDIK